MVTRIHRVTEENLVARRAAILKELGLTSEELAAKVASGGLVVRVVRVVRDRGYRLPPRA